MSFHNRDAPINAVPDELAARLRGAPSSTILGSCD